MSLGKFFNFLMGAGGDNLFGLLFWAPFNEVDSTPIDSPHQTYSGQLMNVTQSAGQLSTFNSLLTKTGAGAVSANLLKSQDGIARTAGRCIAFRFKYNGSGTMVQCGYDQPAAANPAHQFQISSNKILGVDRFSASDINFVTTPDTWYNVFIVLRNNGAYWFILDGINYYLFYVSSRWNYATIHQYISIGNVADIDWAREKQLVAPFLTDWGIATDSTITNAVAGNTFTSLSNAWIVFYLQTKSSSALIEFRFRIQDANNYLKLTIDSTNVGRFYETVAGVDTLLATGTGNFAQGQEYRMLLNGSSIKIFGDGSTALQLNATSSNFLSQTSHQLISEGTGGNVTYIVTLPFLYNDISIVSQFDEIAAISEPAASSIVSRTIWASPSGSGIGTEASPYSFATAIANLEPGVTLRLKGGTYTNANCNFNFSGVSTYPIFIKPAVGEHVIIDSVDDFIVNGSDVVIDGTDGVLEIMCDSWTGDRFLTSQNFDVGILGARTKIKNCVIHDFGNVGFWSPAVDSEFIGNFIYNIGRGNGSQGHPLYTQNNFGTKLIENNLFVQTFESGFGIHQYGSGAATLVGYTYLKNMVIGGRWLCGSAASKVSGLRIENNICYPSRIEIGLLGLTDPLHEDFQIINNRVTDITIKRGTDFEITGNKVIGTNVGILTINNVVAPYSIDDNDYVYYGGGIPFNKFQLNAVNYSSFALWQAAGNDTLGTYTEYPASVPPDFQQVFVNRLDPTRATVWIENFSGAASVAIDLSEVTGLVIGQTYRLYNAQNFAEYHQFVHDGNPVSVVMTGWTVSTPIGTGGGAMTPQASIFPTFGAFYLMKAI